MSKFKPKLQSGIFYNSDGQNLYGAKNILYIELWSYMNCEAIKNRLLINGYLFYCLQFLKCWIVRGLFWDKVVSESLENGKNETFFVKKWISKRCKMLISYNIYGIYKELLGRTPFTWTKKSLLLLLCRWFVRFL